MRAHTIMHLCSLFSIHAMSSCLVATESASTSADITAINLIMKGMSLEEKEPELQKKKPELEEQKPESKPAAAAVPVAEQQVEKKEEPVVLADISKATGWESSEDDL